MGKCEDLEAALAKAEADWRMASDEFDKARALLIKSNASWDKFVNGRRQIESDRRKAAGHGPSVREIWNWIVNDRRGEKSERRKARSKLFAFSKDAADQRGAFIERSKAEAGLAETSAKLIAAIGARQKARAALDESDCAQAKPLRKPK